MAKTLEQILGLPALMGLIQETSTGLPEVLPPSFSNIKREVIGDSARLYLGQGQRRVSRTAKYGAVPTATGLANLGSQDYKLIASYEEQPIDPITMQRLHQYDDYSLQRMGIQEVGRQVGLFKQRFENLRNITKLQVLRRGAIYVDGSGNLLPTSAGAVETFDFQMSANNQNQLNGIIDSPWSLQTTNIPGQVRALRQRARQQTGYPLKYAFYGLNVPGYVQINAYCQEYLARNPKANAEFSTSGEIPDGFMDLTWIPVYESFFEDSAGVNQTVFGADTVVLTPDPSVVPFWEIVEGSNLVPTTIDIIPSASDSFANARMVFGMFAYSQMVNKPIGLVNVMGDTFLPALKLPNTIFQSEVAGY